MAVALIGVPPPGRPRWSRGSSVLVQNVDPDQVLLLCVLAVLGVALLFGAFAMASTRRRWAPFLTTGFLLLLGGRAVLAARADWEWAMFPWPGYAFVHGFVIYALAAPFFGIAAAALPVRWNRVVVLCCGLVVVGHGVCRNAWLGWPEVHGDARVAAPDHHVRQSTHYTCGPAACAAALSHCGLVVTERELAAACLTRREGTTLFDLYRGVVHVIGDRPLDVSIEAVTAEQIATEQLVVVGANSGHGHALCVAGRGALLTWHDPLRHEAQTVSLERLRAEFRPPAIVIRPRGGFAKSWR